MRVTRIGPQRRLAALIACAVALAVFVAPLSLPQAQAQGQDAMAQARNHFKRGNDLFAKGEYEAAISEFAQADNLAPSPTLEFNIALCYDRLGDRAEALRRYKLYLQEVPGAANRDTVEAKIRRIQGELREESEARTAAAEARAAADAAAAAKAAAAAAAAEAARPAPTPQPPEDLSAKPVQPQPGYTPPTAPPPSYGASEYQDESAPSDPDLARVAAIDVAAIRNQRMAGSYGRSEAGAYGPEPSGGAYGPEPSGQEPPVDAPKKKASKPIYKQWWFWVVAGVSTIILIDFATQDSSSSNQRLLFEPQRQGDAPSQGGLEWRF